MVYELSGEIIIDPPLNLAEIKKAREVALKMLRTERSRSVTTPEKVFEDFMTLDLVIEKSEEETDEAVVITTIAPRLKSVSDHTQMTYDPAQIVSALAKALPGHAWRGRIRALREDYLVAIGTTVNIAEGGHIIPGINEVKGEAYIQWEDDSPAEKVTDLI